MELLKAFAISRLSDAAEMTYEHSILQSVFMHLHNDSVDREGGAPEDHRLPQTLSGDCVPSP